jgi:hypothetical protein
MVAEFVAAIRERRQPAITGADGRESPAIATNIYASARRTDPA